MVSKSNNSYKNIKILLNPNQSLKNTSQNYFLTYLFFNLSLLIINILIIKYSPILNFLGFFEKLLLSKYYVYLVLFILLLSENFLIGYFVKEDLMDLFLTMNIVFISYILLDRMFLNTIDYLKTFSLISK